MKIAICIPVPNGGQQLFSLLADSAARMASGRHDITIDITCHSEPERAAILKSGAPLRIARSHIVPLAEKLPPSVIHSECINTLFASVEADLAVVSDFDIAFTYKDWDALLADRLIDKGLSLFGVRYSADTQTIEMSTGRFVGKKSQVGPNCMFMAFSPARLKTITDRLCDIAPSWRNRQPIPPLKRIDSDRESARYGVPVGSFVFLDTGSRVPHLIQDHRLTYETLERRTESYRVLTSAKFAPGYNPVLLPEEYFFEGSPFVAHLRKGSRKIGDHHYGPDEFSKDIKAWLAAPHG